MQIKTKIVSSHAADSKPVKQEANSKVILPLKYSLVMAIKKVLYLWPLTMKWPLKLASASEQDVNSLIIMRLVVRPSVISLNKILPNLGKGGQKIPKVL